jgi:hypothetical protein
MRLKGDQLVQDVIKSLLLAQIALQQCIVTHEAEGVYRVSIIQSVRLLKEAVDKLGEV